MKILWVNPNFLHPTTKGGQIRTLEMVRLLHQRHEIHYAAFVRPGETEGVERSGEYSSHAFSFPHAAPAHRSAAFAIQALRSLSSPLPLSMLRYTHAGLQSFLAQAVANRTYDSIVCDFLAPAANFPRLDNAVLFQHNVESVTVRRMAEQATDPIRRAFFNLQARRMFAYEKQACLRSGFVAAVSENDAQVMRSEFGLEKVADIGTGVNLAYFAPQAAQPGPELVFIGSMDYLPNIDGIAWFTSAVLPLIWKHRPSCRLAIVGRDPSSRIQALANDPRIVVTGTVPDVRPYLWGGQISIVPLRVGGGTRLKIYESMAARAAMVSTTVGAEGLAVTHGETALLADSPEAFAQACLGLLDEPERCQRLAVAGREFVASHHGWDTVTNRFEQILERVPAR